MAINLLNIQPHKVSRDLSGYMIYVYGPGGVGKTTLAAQIPNCLILAGERGYSTIPGVMAQDILSWSDIKQVVRELKKPEVKQAFKAIAVDTIDILAALCEKYVCNQLGVENIGDGGWTNNGWAKVKKEWETTFRTISMEGYALFFISHSKDKIFKRKDGTEYNQIVPTCSNAYNEIIKNMVDVMAYIDITTQGERVMVMRSQDNSIDCKCRFKYMEPVIKLGYQELTNALNAAIDKEAKETDGKFVTNERILETKTIDYNYDELQNEFQEIVGRLMQSSSTNAAKITAIVDKYLGKGKKVAEATPEQAELIYLINLELKNDLI